MDCGGRVFHSCGTESLHSHGAESCSGCEEAVGARVFWGEQSFGVWSLFLYVAAWKARQLGDGSNMVRIWCLSSAMTPRFPVNLRRALGLHFFFFLFNEIVLLCDFCFYINISNYKLTNKMKLTGKKNHEISWDYIVFKEIKVRIAALFLILIFYSIPNSYVQ